jgi:hypothetical protein
MVDVLSSAVKGNVLRDDRDSSGGEILVVRL